MFEEEMNHAYKVLTNTLRYDAYRLYGRRTVAYDNYWGGDFKQYQKAINSIDSYGGLPSLRELLKQLAKVVEIVDKKEKEYEDQETIERKTFTYNNFFKVIANELSEVVIEALLEPIDIFEHIFKRRGVEVLLHEALDKIYLHLDENGDEIEEGVLPMQDT